MSECVVCDCLLVEVEDAGTGNREEKGSNVVQNEDS